ncbi:hypothetical protein ACQPXS_03700 [Streptomyces sp. CA-142005]|uniref:hypothetical protein n=1 Tax=Streptomyces sp. CA-142005 TaxID=3240052 RepID=UPI003D933273
MTNAVVVGGGLNGLAAAITLAPRGCRSRCWRPLTRSAAAPAPVRRTPPGPGAHGMCGAHAARRALRHLAHR